MHELRFHARFFERSRDRFAATMHYDWINSDRIEKNDIARDPMPLFRIGRVHETAAVFHHEDLAAETLDVRQRFDQRRRFRNELFHFQPPSVAGSVISPLLKAT